MKPAQAYIKELPEAQRTAEVIKLIEDIIDEAEAEISASYDDGYNDGCIEIE